MSRCSLAASPLSHGKGPVNLSYCIRRDDQTEAASSPILHDQYMGSRTIVNHIGLAELTLDEFVGIAYALRGVEEGKLGGRSAQGLNQWVMIGAGRGGGRRVLFGELG